VNSNPARKAILIVDDEKAYLDLMADMLTEYLGCPVFTFLHPEKALAALPNLNIGFVVTDYHMPQVNGLDFMRKVRSLVPDVPFVLISGNAIQFADREFAEDFAPRAILEKPFSWRRLADEIVLNAPEFGAARARPAGDPTTV
jgi:two-component SAPR family response regulator